MISHARSYNIYAFLGLISDPRRGAHRNALASPEPLAGLFSSISFPKKPHPKEAFDASLSPRAMGI